MAALPPPPPETDVPRRRKSMTVYLSPLRPGLRTRVWLEYVDFPPHLWTRRAANGCLITFGGVTHLDAAEFRRSGRMVAEARVTRVAEVPRWVTVFEADVPGLAGQFVVHYVRLVVLSAEPSSMRLVAAPGSLRSAATANRPALNNGRSRSIAT